MVIVRIEIETKGGDIKIKRMIEVKGTGIKSELEIIERFDEDGVQLRANLSSGEEQNINVLPDEASQIVLEILRINNFSIELREVGEGDDVKAVYLAEGNKSGKLLGLFDVNLAVEVQIDSETGDIIRYSEPWWAFLVFGFEEVVPDEDFINETNETGTIGDLNVS